MKRKSYSPPLYPRVCDQLIAQNDLDPIPAPRPRCPELQRNALYIDRWGNAASLPLYFSRFCPSSYPVCGTFSKRPFVVYPPLASSSSDPCRSSMPICIQTHRFCDRCYLVNIPRHSLAYPRVTGSLAPTRSYRHFDPSKYYLEGWIDGSTETDCRGPASREQNEEVKSKLFVIRSNRHVSIPKVSPKRCKGIGVASGYIWPTNR